MKKKALLLLAAVLALCFAACSSGKTTYPEVLDSGFPEKYAGEREKVMELIAHPGDAVDLVTSRGKLVEAAGDEALFRYYGGMKGAKPDGYGIVLSRGALIFGGEFNKGKPCGYGIVFDADDYGNHSDVYEGDDCTLLSIGGLRRFRASGKGFIYDDVAFYGKGEPSILYAGELNKNERDGEGQEFYPGDTGFGPLCYAGEFKDNKYSGDGTLYAENGNIINEGGFKRGLYSGKGVLYDATGAVKYKGKFVGGEIKG